MTFKKHKFSQCWWLTLQILAIWKVEIRKTEVQGQPEQIFLQTPSPK
jgi:hypothetical protein